jgi:hypothetical protein
VWKWNGNAWACDPDSGITYSGVVPIVVSGANVSLDSTACLAGQTWKWDGVSWDCQDDNNTTYSAAATGGLEIVSGTQFSLIRSCASGQVLKWSVAAGWACQSDTDTNTTYSPQTGGGLELNGTTFSMLRSCAANQVLKWDSVTSSWRCNTDSDTTYSAGSGLALVSNVFSVGSDVITAAHIANDAVGTGEIADGAIATADIAPNAVGMAELTLPMGDSRGTTNVTITSLTDSFVATSLVMPATGVCVVIATVTIDDNTASANPTAGDRAIMNVVHRVNTTVTAGTNVVNIGAFQGDQTSATVAESFAVTGGTSYTFGCRVTATGGWLGEEIGTCNVAWVCT